MTHELNALAPHVAAEIPDYRYGKHHLTYAAGLNNPIRGKEFEDTPLEEIVEKSTGGAFNNAAQVWKHTFYWVE